MPTPESWSVPGARMSSAVAFIAVSTCAAVQSGRADLTSAATAAACGAAAAVAKKGRKPGVLEELPSAAETSG
jgi:nitrous oxide reductase